MNSRTSDGTEEINEQKMGDSNGVAGPGKGGCPVGF